MTDFWDSNVWSFLCLISVLFAGIIIAHILKNNIKFLKRSLIPTSVLGGLIILVFTTIFKFITDKAFFDLDIFSTIKDGANIVSGTAKLEMITYHCLGLGFVAMGLRYNDKSKSKVTAKDVFNTGITTVSTYLMQAFLGILITIIAVRVFKVEGMIEGAGAILCFGYGQGTGQALNFGKIYELGEGAAAPLVNGANFGLSIAALGFLSASIGGVIYLNALRKRHKVSEYSEENSEELLLQHIQEKDEISLSGSVDKFTIEVAFVVILYAVSYFLMNLLGNLIPGLKSVIFGFNFLIGTLFATLFKSLMKFLNKRGIVKKNYINNFMLNRIGGILFDVMIVAGIAVIDLELIRSYLGLILILGFVGAVSTFFFIRFVCHRLFGDYCYEQFFAMFGMLTGTASTGIILLREIDPNFDTPASDNLVYQNLPAIIFGLPIMLLANYCYKGPRQAVITMFALLFAFIAMVILLFRNQIFKRKTNENQSID